MPRAFALTKMPVKNRGIPPDAFLNELVEWGRGAADEIFAPRKDDRGETDVYTSVKPVLGPWESAIHRRAAMLEVMRVLAGFESSWDWKEGVDTTNARSMANIRSEEAGAWQVSYDSLAFGSDLRALSISQCVPLGAKTFIDAMKSDHAFAMEYIARLLRHTIRHNGPVKRREIHPFLDRGAVGEFAAYLA